MIASDPPVKTKYFDSPDSARASIADTDPECVSFKVPSSFHCENERAEFWSVLSIQFLEQGHELTGSEGDPEEPCFHSLALPFASPLTKVV
jgi:hypothetical protein